MLFDTDIFIWIQRGSVKAARLLENCGERLIAVQTYMELMQGAKNKTQLTQTRRFLRDFNVSVIPLSAEIGNRAMSLVEQYALRTTCVRAMQSLPRPPLTSRKRFARQTTGTTGKSHFWNYRC